MQVNSLIWRPILDSRRFTKFGQKRCFIQHGDTLCVLKITLRIEAVRRTMSGYLAVVLVTTGAGTLLLLVLGSLHTQTIWLTRATSPIKLLIFLFFSGFTNLVIVSLLTPKLVAPSKLQLFSHLFTCFQYSISKLL